MSDTTENRDRLVAEINEISKRLAQLAREAQEIDDGIFNLLHCARDALADARIKLSQLAPHLREENL